MENPLTIPELQSFEVFSASRPDHSEFSRLRDKLLRKNFAYFVDGTVSNEEVF